jgi:hypothetical protein
MGGWQGRSMLLLSDRVPPIADPTPSLDRRQASLVSRYAELMSDNLFLSEDGCRAIGVAYHIADVFLPELQKAVKEVAGQAGPAAAPSAEVLASLLNPFVMVLVKASDQPLLTRVRCVGASWPWRWRRGYFDLS